MPKIVKELKPLAISKIKTEGLHAVGGVPGLYLQIMGNSRSWIFRAKIGGHRQKIGLGSCMFVSLAEARDKAWELHKQIRDGINPLEERRAAKARAKMESAETKTFQECAEAFIIDKRVEWGDTHARKYESSLELYVYPIIGGVPVANIDVNLVLEVLQQPIDTPDGKAPFWNVRTETASRVRGRIESVLQWAKVRGLREGENPAEWKTLKYTLPAKSKIYKAKNFPALPYIEVGLFMTELRKHEGMPERALEFLILTAVRSGEVRGATWEEINLSERIWTLPEERMKMDKEHNIPLSDSALRLLEAMPRYEGNNLIFPPERAAKLSELSLLSVIRYMHKEKFSLDGRGWIDPKQNNRVITVHGFRSCFDDWATETTFHDDKAIDYSLAHKLPDKVRSAYQRGAMFMKRIQLMADWGRYCDTIVK
jgi:integrase